MSQNDALGFLGLLYPTHQVIIGEELRKRMSEATLVVVATDLDSGESLRTLGKIKRAHKPLSQTFTAKELGKALGHSEIKFLGIIGKKAAMSYLLKLKKGESDEKTAVH